MDEEQGISEDEVGSLSGGEEDEMEAIEMGSGSEEAEEGEEDEEEEEEGSGGGAKSEVYLPGQGLEEGEELVHDSSTYHLYHAAQTGAPCLSFDILWDTLGDSRTSYPMTAYMAAGTQTEEQNFVILMKMSQLKETTHEGEDEDSDDETLDDDVPQLDTVMVVHPGAINRLRVAPVVERRLVATWSERGVVSIWDTSKHVILLDSPTVGGASGRKPFGHKEKPLFAFTGHKSEGFALDWSGTVLGRLVTGDCSGCIHLWQPSQEGAWSVDQRSYTAHSSSVEDLQWSPNEATVFASCSCDQSVRIWDCRAKPSKACMLTVHAHDSDVNVISWNRREPFIVSGGDDGKLKVWDLRKFKKGEPAVVFKHHTAPVTSVEWHPDDSTVFASAGEDDQAVQWDLAVECDETEVEALPADIPPQLLFIHQGQKEIKELHWHPQLPGVLITTAHTGFNIFKTISV